MPELGEVSHAASMLRKYALGKTIVKTSAIEDEIVFVKPLTSSLLETALKGKVTSVGRNGKYFWFELAKKQTVLLHFGMTGWIHVKDVATHFIAMESGGDKKQKAEIKKLLTEGKDPADIKYTTEVWPPKFTKFHFQTDDGYDLAFTDPRRLGRVRWFDKPAAEIADLEPLKNLGIDYSQDLNTLEEFSKSALRRRVPVKSYLLDQSLFSGIGNWMGDEILYQARIHPEQYTNTLTEDQLSALYKSVLDVCRISAETEGNSAQFPRDWLMLHRWGKARKNEKQTTADGHLVSHVTVGGRTSCFVPDLQKIPSSISEPAATAVKQEPRKLNGNSKNSRKRSRVSRAKHESSDDDNELSNPLTTLKAEPNEEQHSPGNDLATPADAPIGRLRRKSAKYY